MELAHLVGSGHRGGSCVDSGGDFPYVCPNVVRGCGVERGCHPVDTTETSIISVKIHSMNLVTGRAWVSLRGITSHLKDP